MINWFRRTATGTNSVRGASAILAATLLLSNLLGLVRDHFLGQKIPTASLDTYYAAFQIPNFLFNVLIFGAVSAAFIPTLSHYLAKDEKEGWHVANATFTLSLVFLIVSAAIVAVLMPYLVPFVVAGFSVSKAHTTVIFAQILMIQPVIFGISYLFSAVLTVRKRFLIYGLAPIIYNLSIIIATYFFGSQFQVMAVIIGVIIGAFCHLLIQAVAAYAIGYRPRLVWDLQHPALRRIALLMLPRSIGLGGMQVVLLIFTGIASTLVAGSLAIYSLTDNIRTMPLAVFAISFATALFPTLSDAHAKDDEKTFSAYLIQGLRSIAFLNLPSAIGLLLLRAQIIRLILGSGYFDWQATQLAAQTLGVFAFGLVAEGFVQLLSRAFYARHDTKNPTIISLAGNVIMVLIGLGAARYMGVAGLALGFTVGITVQALVLYLRLRAVLPSLVKQERQLGIFVSQVAVGLIALALTVQLTKWLVVAVGVPLSHTWGVLLQTVLAIIFGSSVYFMVTHQFRIPEVSTVWRSVMARLVGGSVKPVSND